MVTDLVGSIQSQDTGCFHNYHEEGALWMQDVEIKHTYFNRSPQGYHCSAGDVAKYKKEMVPGG